MSKLVQSRWPKAIRTSSIIAPLALALAACGAEAPVAEADEAESAGTMFEEPLPVMGPERVVLGFGDSLMAGYNVEEDQGYPEVLGRALRGRGINARVIDAGVSGDTTAAGLQRIGFVLDNADAEIDLAIVELGGNDLLRGITPDQSRANLEGILDELQARDIPILLLGMRAPPNMGVEYQQQFDGMYAELAEEYDAALVPFFMKPVYDQPRLMQADRIHPTAEGLEEMVAASLDTVIAALPQDGAD
ncbi:arylesterase [Aurantiacibacter sp. MUD11]|uniref:arylesterase n=1 Tax=Aurantiacibacter sp. MUD11 TaxID=3003265 RepID=UPI0022AA97F3|nr:arylesterase [Aurantiacibacter sp. MUD11]WAT19005.1 arylesterase [Aurantiacibacter sp. MUD11]